MKVPSSSPLIRVLEHRFHLSLGLVLVAALLCLPGPAAAANGWWNREWSERKLLRIDTGAAGAQIVDPIGATAVLVRLHLGDFNFDSAKEDGSDLRFVAADGRTLLKHHVESSTPYWARRWSGWGYPS